MGPRLPAGKKNAVLGVILNGGWLETEVLVIHGALS